MQKILQSAFATVKKCQDKQKCYPVIVLENVFNTRLCCCRPICVQSFVELTLVKVFQGLAFTERSRVESRVSQISLESSAHYKEEEKFSKKQREKNLRWHVYAQSFYKNFKRLVSNRLQFQREWQMAISCAKSLYKQVLYFFSLYLIIGAALIGRVISEFCWDSCHIYKVCEGKANMNDITKEW